MTVRKIIQTASNYHQIRSLISPEIYTVISAGKKIVAEVK
jgi:hypothetical protein